MRNAVSLITCLLLNSLIACQEDPYPKKSHPGFWEDWDNIANSQSPEYDSGWGKILSDELRALDRDSCNQVLESYVKGHSDSESRVIRIVSRYHGKDLGSNEDEQAFVKGGTLACSLDVYWIIYHSPDTMRMVYSIHSKTGRRIVDTSFGFSTGFLDSLIIQDYDKYQVYHSMPLFTTTVSLWSRESSRHALIVGNRAVCDGENVDRRKYDSLHWPMQADFAQIICLIRQYGKQGISGQ